MVSNFLLRLKNFIVLKLGFPRNLFLFRFARRVYKFFIFLDGYWLKKRTDRLHGVFLGNKSVSSLSIDRGKRIIVEFSGGSKFYWNDLDNPESLLGMIVRDEKVGEPTVTKLLSLVVRPGDTVFDIGANFGWHSIPLSHLVGPTGWLYCFEPVPAAYEALKENISLNFPGNQRIVLEKLAVGNFSGRTSIYIPDRLGPAFATLLPDYHRGTEFSRSTCVEVVIIKLDDYIKKMSIPRLDFIKCDIEGAELAMVSGGVKCLSASEAPIILLEISSMDSRDIFPALVRFGYIPWYLESGRLKKLSEEDTENRLPDYNFLFAKKTHLDRLKSLL